MPAVRSHTDLFWDRGRRRGPRADSGLVSNGDRQLKFYDARDNLFLDALEKTAK